MTRPFRVLATACWDLGLISVVTPVILKPVPAWADMVNATPRGGLILAGALFLCVLARRKVDLLASPRT